MNLSLPASVGAGRVTDWLVAPGDSVTVGQPIAVLLTKTQELALPAEMAGTVEALLANLDATVAPGEPLLQLSDSQATPSNSAAPKMTPLARAIAAANGLEPASITGSGLAGRIVKRDVLALLNGTPSGFCVAEQIGGRGEEQVIIVPTKAKPQPTLAALEAPPMTITPRPSQIVAQPRTVPISAAPVALLAIEVDATALEHRCADRLMARRGITPAVLILHAVAQTLWQMPQMRVHWHTDGLIQRANVHLAVMGLGEPRTLVNVADLAPTGIARALQAPPQPFEEAPVCTITLTSQQPMAAWWSDPRLPDGQTLLLHCGGIVRQPVVRTIDGLDQVVIRPMFTLLLAFDMRAITPWQADQCMQRLQTILLAS